MKLQKRCRKCVFFLLIALTVLPIPVFPVLRRFNHQIHNSPRIESGVLDLGGYEPKGGYSLPLDGEWEFYWNKWLVTDHEPAGEPDRMLRVPYPWSMGKADGRRLPEGGYASYRVVVKNDPGDQNLLCFIPNLGISYRVFQNGKLVAKSGYLSKEPRERDVTLALIRDWMPEDEGPLRELVIEVSGARGGGITNMPMLMDSRTAYIATRLRYAIAGICVGALLVLIAGCAYLLFLRDISLHSVALLVLDLMVFLRILMRDELFCLLKLMLPSISYHWVNLVLQIGTLYLPVAFLLCAKDLAGIRLERREIRGIILFETACCLPMFFFLNNGMLYSQGIFCLITMTPFLLVLRRIYQKVADGAPYTLIISAGILLTISSLLVANQAFLGMVGPSVTLYPTVCFVVAVLLQGYLYIRKNTDLHADALEAAELRLKLQESETSLMLSQIKPHFLYNALIAIQVLCTREPETAEEAVVHFAKYLRMNMRSINSREPIPFSQELEHIRNYVAIEKLRFKDRLQMAYEIGDENFRVPALTIQPLVENAIKHGACKKIMGGTVTLRTYDAPMHHCVEILDDGPGFDPAVLEQPDSGSYGLKNISLRLRQVMGAEITIESGPDKGTKVLVRLLKTEGTHESDHSG